MSGAVLVDFLVEGDHPITMDRYASMDDVRDAIGDSVLLIRCTDTRGTTELACEIIDNLAGSTVTTEERFSFVGEFTLDDIDFRVSASVATSDLAGTARFERI